MTEVLLKGLELLEGGFGASELAWETDAGYQEPEEESLRLLRLTVLGDQWMTYV
jgi:hypothetical protein